MAAGGVRRTPKEAVDALVEAIGDHPRHLGHGPRPPGERSVTRRGEHYPVAGLHVGPAPLHDVEIWLGAYKPRMLRVTGRLADGWLPSMGYADPSRPRRDERDHRRRRRRGRPRAPGDPADVQRLRPLRLGRRLPAGHGRQLGRAARRTDARARHEHLRARQRRPRHGAPLRRRGRACRARARAGRAGTPSGPAVRRRHREPHRCRPVCRTEPGRRRPLHRPTRRLPTARPWPSARLRTTGGASARRSRGARTTGR